MNGNLFNSNILYYPSIEFNNPSFIKSALCIWDTVYRIVPEGYIPDDCSEIRLAVETGAIKDIKLSPRDLKQTSVDFITFIESQEYLPAGLTGYPTINLHKDKVDHRLYPYLQSLAFEMSENYFNLSKEVAHGYMLHLANNVASNRCIPKITDNKDVFSLMAYYETEGLVDEYIYSTDSDLYYSTLVIPTFIPKGISTVDMDFVLRYREKTQKGRAELRNTIHDFTEDLLEVKDWEYAKELCEKKKIQILEANNSIIDSSKLFLSSFIQSSLVMGLPMAVSTLSLFAGGSDIFTPHKIGGVGAISAIAPLLEGAKTVRKARRIDSSYLLNLNRTFQDEINFISSSSSNYTRVLNEFIND